LLREFSMLKFASKVRLLDAVTGERCGVTSACKMLNPGRKVEAAGVYP
jgi:hypothetical protein